MQSSSETRSTSLSLMTLGWLSLRRDLISLKSMHSAHEVYFAFIFLIATTQPVLILVALQTDPKAPSPSVLMVLYFYIQQFITTLSRGSTASPFLLSSHYLHALFISPSSIFNAQQIIAIATPASGTQPGWASQAGGHSLLTHTRDDRGSPVSHREGSTSIAIKGLSRSEEQSGQSVGQVLLEPQVQLLQGQELPRTRNQRDQLLQAKHALDKKQYLYMEMGCGVGNTLFPLLRDYPFFDFIGCDISATAIELIEKEMVIHPEYQGRLSVKVCDLVKDEIPFEQKPDLLSMIFVLSAIVPQKHGDVIKKIADWMKPGSFFYFRDYGRYDFGQINMSNKGKRKLTDNFYVKHDGVCVYYFDQKDLEKLFEDAGLVKVEGSVHCRLLENRKTGLKMYRVWVQGRFYKPPLCQYFQQVVGKELKQRESKKQENNEEKVQVRDDQPPAKQKTEEKPELEEPEKDFEDKRDKVEEKEG